MKHKHADLKKKIHNTHYKMISRCYNMNDHKYEIYGQRGIKVCDEWLNDRECFQKWAIESGCNHGLSIERIDVDGDYCPDNCTWATPKEQANNRRNSIANRFDSIDFLCMHYSHFRLGISLKQTAKDFSISRRSMVRKFKELNFPIRTIKLMEVEDEA